MQITLGWSPWSSATPCQTLLDVCTINPTLRSLSQCQGSMRGGATSLLKPNSCLTTRQCLSPSLPSLRHHPLSVPPLKGCKCACPVFQDSGSLGFGAAGFFQPLHLNGLCALCCAGFVVADHKDGGDGEEGDAQEDADQTFGQELGLGGARAGAAVLRYGNICAVVFGDPVDGQRLLSRWTQIGLRQGV